MTDEQRAHAPSIDTIRDTMRALDSWEDRYMYLIELGRSLDTLGPHERTDANLVPGCQSRVWMVTTNEHGRLRVRAESDSRMVSGLIAVLIALYDNTPLEQVRDIPAHGTVRELGLGEHLSAGRRNGIESMIARILVDTDRAL